MPTYDFRCEDHGVRSVVMSLHEVTSTIACPDCDRPARRVYSSPQLRLGDSSARQLLDSTARTADEPPVVSSPVGRPMVRRGRRPALDPRTAKLPRP